MNMSPTKRTRALSAVIGIAAIALASAAAAKNWDDWSSPANLESLPGSSSAMNTPSIDGCASHSPDGLTIVFNSNRDGTGAIYRAARLAERAEPG